MNTKPFYQSKTLWVQFLSILSVLFPAVQGWLADNPVEVMSVFVAINTLVRFVTSGKIQPFNPDSKFPLVCVGLLSMAAVGGLLPSCSTVPQLKIPEGITGSLNYRSEKTGGAYGLECDAAGCVPTIIQPFIDKDGNVVGEFEVNATK